MPKFLDEITFIDGEGKERTVSNYAQIINERGKYYTGFNDDGTGDATEGEIYKQGDGRLQAIKAAGDSQKAEIETTGADIIKEIQNTGAAFTGDVEEQILQLKQFDEKHNNIINAIPIDADIYWPSASSSDKAEFGMWSIVTNDETNFPDYENTTNGWNKNDLGTTGKASTSLGRYLRTDSAYSLNAGYSNAIYCNSPASSSKGVNFALGYGNLIGKKTKTDATIGNNARAFAHGYQNKIVSGSNNFVSGVNNIIDGNNIDTSSIFGSSNYLNSSKTHLIGIGLIAHPYDSNLRSQVIVGSYNEEVTGSDKVFVVGTGIASSRKNTFTVSRGGAQVNGTLDVSGATSIDSLTVARTISTTAISATALSEFTTIKASSIYTETLSTKKANNSYGSVDVGIVHTNTLNLARKGENATHMLRSGTNSYFSNKIYYCPDLNGQIDDATGNYRQDKYLITNREYVSDAVSRERQARINAINDIKSRIEQVESEVLSVSYIPETNTLVIL